MNITKHESLQFPVHVRMYVLGDSDPGYLRSQPPTGQMPKDVSQARIQIIS